MAPATVVLAPLVFLVVWAGASRISVDVGSGSWQVHLLITAHGTACHDLLTQWSGLEDTGRTLMPDPMLAGIGERAAAEAGKAIQEWTSGQIDAVLSSELARAQHMAALMLPETVQAKELTVAPYIRNKEEGPANTPDPAPMQGKKLAWARASAAGKFKIHNFHHGKPFSGEAGSWEDFLTYLRKGKLPAMQKSGEHGQGPVTLVVVTDPYFMAKQVPIARTCGDYWLKKGLERPLGGQTVAMEYKFSWDERTGKGHKYLLEETGTPCKEVSPGVSTEADGQLRHLCLADIGGACLAAVSEYSYRKQWAGKSFLDVTVEGSIVNWAMQYVFNKKPPADLEGLKAACARKCFSGDDPKPAEYQRLKLGFNAQYDVCETFL